MHPDLAFLFRLAENLGKTVAELLTGKPQPLSLAEMKLWVLYRNTFGFQADRLENTNANGASAACYAFGAKTKASDIIAIFGRRRPSLTKIINELASLPGAEVVFFPTDGGPVLRGQEALAKADPVEKPRYANSKTLDGDAKKSSQNRPKERGNSKTLAGD